MIGDHHFIKVFKVQVQFFVFEKRSSQSINHVKEKPRLMLLHIKDLSYREKFAGSRSVAPKHRQFFLTLTLICLLKSATVYLKFPQD